MVLREFYKASRALSSLAGAVIPYPSTFHGLWPGYNNDFYLDYNNRHHRYVFYPCGNDFKRSRGRRAGLKVNQREFHRKNSISTRVTCHRNPTKFTSGHGVISTNLISINTTSSNNSDNTLKN